MVQGNVSSFQVSRVALVYSKWIKIYFFSEHPFEFYIQSIFEQNEVEKMP